MKFCTVQQMSLVFIPTSLTVKGWRRCGRRWIQEEIRLFQQSLVSLGKLVLEINVLEFDGKVYRQKLGTAIGTKFVSA